MNSLIFVTVVQCLLLISLAQAKPQHQQQIDPAYLQQYYAQVAQAAGAQAGAEATPIYEQATSADQQQQYIAQQLPQGQQYRVKDNVAEQVRAQQQQQYVAPSVRQYQQPKPQPQQVQYLAQPQQQIHYRPQPQQVPKHTLAVSAPRRPAPQPQYQHQHQQHQQQEEGSRLNKEEEETYDQNPSYQFGFDVKDDEFTNYQNRKESRDGNVIKGSYSVVDSDGFIRTVTYTADPKEGFKAEVVREPTDIVVKVPTPAPITAQQSQGGGHLRAHQQAAAPQPQYYHQQPQPQQQQHQQYRAAPKQQPQQQQQYQYE